MQLFSHFLQLFSYFIQLLGYFIQLFSYFVQLLSYFIQLFSQLIIKVTSPPGLHQSPGHALGSGIGSSFPKLMQNLVAAPATVAEERREGQQPGSYPHQV